MGKVKSVLHWLGAKIRRFREFASGDDLHEAQMNRGDDHEFKMHPGGPTKPASISLLGLQVRQ